MKNEGRVFTISNMIAAEFNQHKFQPQADVDQYPLFNPEAVQARREHVVIDEHGEIAADGVERCPTFDAIGLNEPLLRGVYAYGFEIPSAIQQMAIKPILLGRDVIAQAQSGTGKTATFSLGALSRVDPKINGCQAMILSPTRELAEQTGRVVSELSRYLGIKSHICIGGTTIRDDIKTVRAGVHIVIGTPGRVFGLLTEKHLSIHNLRVFVLDEADEMLSAGFTDQVKDIFQYCPEDVQSVVVSATMPPEVLEVTSRFMKDPLRILVKAEELTLRGIRQFYVALDEDAWKFETLCDLYQTISITQSVIFCSSRRRVESLCRDLWARDFTVSQIHSDMNASERNLVMKEFRSGKTRILVATDIIARGIDVQQVSLVINYDLPRDKEKYIHRIGRSGRHGKKGVAINFITKRDVAMLREIETFYSTEITEMPIDISSLL